MTHYGSVADTARDALTDDAMVVLCQQYLDDYTYRIMASPLSKKWLQHDVYKSALEMLTLHGVQYTPEEIATVAKFEEQMMIMDMVSRMSDDVRGRFEQITRHLRSLIS